ncbi:Anthocyanidin 3-O-glucosyltransferase 6 [Hibiscus syriacus]|uniref:Anthocyanidin 3-O-glucosyltransferase 6 n=1 Tax=Hibiscus syriacus TaxID=106335 RepID=A0A6A2ZGK0_HIBSY|nr:Anthocyanidin 3-O-glucosyltransferase 6 [Hibiscus syriacus]
MKKAELVFIPCPAMGHVVPLVQLANQLVDLNSNLYITVLTVKLPDNAKLNAYIDSLAVADASTSRIKFINLSQYDTDEDAFKFQSNFVQMMELLVKEFVTNIVEHSNSVPDSPPLAGFVHDIFLTSSLVDLANEFGVPNYAFFTSGAGSLGFHLYTQALHDKQKIEFDELKDLDTEFTIPSFKFHPFTCGTLTESRRLNQEQSGHRFLWSLRRPEEAVKGMMRIPTDYENMAEVLPEGFLDRTADIGKVIGWAPQAAILGHPATGGFISHCGWNSTLESIWFGVPMVAWPLFAEQQLNALTLVEELGLAVEIKMDYRNHGDEEKSSG